ncbi:FAD-dependent oxidoreductase [Actinospica sp. MGRD01-02]|uniref:FAD-dependent oxidoreductase n=1 Tax=Actinospica acidithermotolerans TaxID=2828514 RepID=A0A941E8X4_9ACTN|nr:FAD-dependent oxidoreductase [Actinospica acidithermotolerans]MBR7827161.1 FAD-dependent oxidoreductase [Actinospica acidithermotolerans]
MDRHIVVIGAGYAGLAAATRAGRKQRVTLIAPEDRFLNRVRQHEVAAGHAEHRPTIAHVLRGRNVTHVQARATELDLAGRKVFTDGGRTPISYDTLVYALGSRTAFHSVPGAREHSYPMERAEELRDRLRRQDDAAVVVVGGGATGIELATELAEAYPERRVAIVDAGEVGGRYSAKGRALVHETLGRLGVEVHEHTEVTAVDDEGLTTASGRIEAGIVAWTASLEVGPLAAQSGLAVNEQGEALVDEYLRSVSHPDVYVVGDAAAVTLPGIGRLRKACATAQPMGWYVGRALARGGASKPYTYRYVVQCMSLGRNSGMVQVVGKDDAMTGRVFGGRTGRLIKAAIVRYVVLGLR